MSCRPRSRRQPRHHSAPNLPTSARFQGLGRLSRARLRTPRMSSGLPRSLHSCEPPATPAMLQNLRDLKEQTWYPDAWVTSLVACFSIISNALYQMVAQLVAPHLTVVRFACIENGGSGIFLLGSLSSNATRGDSSWTPQPNT